MMQKKTSAFEMVAIVVVVQETSLCLSIRVCVHLHQSDRINRSFDAYCDAVKNYKIKLTFEKTFLSLGNSIYH